MNAMLVKQKLGHLRDFDQGEREIDTVELEWFETSKRILHKKTSAGRDVSMKFLKENQELEQDDIIYADKLLLVSIDISPCQVIVLRPAGMFEMACLCYEIGNKHLPLFYEGQALMIPFEAPVYKMLELGGYNVTVETKKLSGQLKTSVTAHLHQGSPASLLSKIIQLTTKPVDV